MQPKNDRQREVVRLSESLPPISTAQMKWAVDHCFLKEAYQSKGRAWCSQCGKEFTADASDLSVTLIGGKAVCPHCETKLVVKTSRKRKLAECWYYTVVTTHGGWQVCRNFIAEKFMRAGGEPYYNIREAVQNWIAPDGHMEVIARRVAAFPYVYDKWDFKKPMELRDARRHDVHRPDKYLIDGSWVYPKRRLLPIVKRNGYTGYNRSGMAESERIRLLLTDRDAEWLEKAGQYDLLRWKANRGFREGCMPFAYAIRVANRAGYKVKDASMWMDYLHLLEHFNLDLHNAHYVCPANLKSAHDRLLKRRRKQEAREAAEKKRQQAKEYEERYKAEKSKYFGICFGNDDIVISVIRSVAEMEEEGKAMDHCVFDACYYKKRDSLILTARDRDGNRIETIEVNLNTFRVVQSRAKHNSVSPRHDEIVALVQENIHRIKQVS